MDYGHADGITTILKKSLNILYTPKGKIGPPILHTILKNACVHHISKSVLTDERREGKNNI